MDVARDLVLRAGARAVTVDGIAATSGAPKGSIYHRFATVDDLLAAMWVRAVRRSQEMFLRELGAGGDPVEVAVAAGLAIHDFAQQEPADARLLAAVRREDLAATVTNGPLATELGSINEPITAGLAALAGRLYGHAPRASIERTACAVVALPHGAIRRHLIAGRPIPVTVRPQLRQAIPAALRVAGNESGDAQKQEA